MHKQTPQTADEARQYAIEWQQWQATEELSLSELAEWQHEFTELGEHFNLTNEFQENGII